MLKDLFGEGKTHVCLLILGVIDDTFLCIRNSQAVILELNMGECSIGEVDGQLALGNPGTLRSRCLDCLRIELHCFFEAVVLELAIALVL